MEVEVGGLEELMDEEMVVLGKEELVWCLWREEVVCLVVLV